MTSISDAIRNARISKGLSQKELSEKSGLSLPTIRAYEQGKRTPRDESARKLEPILDLSHLFLSGQAKDEYALDVLSMLFHTDYKKVKVLFEEGRKNNPDVSAMRIVSWLRESYSVALLEKEHKNSPALKAYLQIQALVHELTKTVAAGGQNDDYLFEAAATANELMHTLDELLNIAAVELANK
ncbi:MAG: helix-turn-helix domain-containing protein [Lacticaseibacillus songhuajiangensis]|nr:helix-turn-helix domain-containing protein [Lacticaseibacillus songhuajiangensis]